MAGFIFVPSANIRTPTAYRCRNISGVDTDFNSSFPMANIGNRYPYRPYKSSSAVSTGNSYIGVSFSGAVTMAAVFVDNINISTIEIEGADNNIFTTSVFGTGNITVSKNIVSRRYKLFYDVLSGPLSGVAKTHWRVRARTSSTNDGDTVLKVGSVCWISSYTTWAHGTTEYGEQPIEATIVNYNFTGGGSEPVVVGNSYAAITLTQAAANRTASRTPIMTMLADEGVGRFGIFAKNSTDTSDAYRCRRVNDVTLRQTAPNLIAFQAFTLEESV